MSSRGWRGFSKWVTAALLAAVFLHPGAPADAAHVPEGYVDQEVAHGLTSPTAMAITPDGRVLVTQQNGEVKLIVGDVLQAASYYHVETDSTNERGLLGITVDPAFAINHFVYLFYTATTPTIHNRVLRVTEAGNAVVAGSEQIIFELPDVPPDTRWHMGGALRFGPDGKLYVAVGNHEDTPQPFATANSQNLTNPFGKILRLEADGSIPADNPFVGEPGAYGAIWSYGFRNPFTFDIQPGTGTMFVNDVGQGTWEEVDRGVRGGNYGWPAVEGVGGDPRFIEPTYAYHHGAEGCSVVGAAFYDPPVEQFPPSVIGKFLFADFCGGWIRALDPATGAVTPLVSDLSYPVNLEVAPDGSVYYLARNQQTGTPNPAGGTVGKITFTGSKVPRFSSQPASQTVVVGDPAVFTAAADEATAYQWQRDEVDIPGATGPTLTLASTTLADNGAHFRLIASNDFGSVTSSVAELTITTNHAPVATLLTPSFGATYAAGETISFSGSGQDAEDGALPPSAFTWQVDFQHDTHTHPFLAPTTGMASGSITIPTPDATDANVWYRIYLTVRDSEGASHTVVRDIRPRTSLSDLTPSAAPVNGWGPFERDLSNGENGAGDGHVMTLDGIPYAKGLGVHAPSDLRYDLAGACTGQLIADIGLDDETGDGGSVTFEVWLDGVKVHDSGLVRGTDPRRPVAVSVAGAGELRLVVTGSDDGIGFDHADWAGVRVTGCDATSNHAPSATIDTPAAGTSYAAGDVIDFSGTGVDPEDGALAASGLTWRVDFHHDLESQPFLAPTTGASGSFTIPAAEATDANVWYRLYLTARDVQGAATTVTRDVRPGTSLSDLEPSAPPTNGWGPIERDLSNGEDAAGDGHVLTLDGIPYAKGLGVHAPSEVRFDLAGACGGKLIADVGLDDETGDGGSVTFEAWLDDAKIYDSGVVHGNDARRPVAVSVAGGSELRLVVTGAGDGIALDHADWAGARVTGCGAPAASADAGPSGAAADAAVADATPAASADAAPPVAHADAAQHGTGPGPDAGCGCRVGSAGHDRRPTGAATAGLLVLAASVLVRRRRRR